MSKSLYELALEYDESIKGVEAIVRSERIKLKEAKMKNDNFEVYSISRKLEMLYEEIRDMKIISQKLKKYYDREVFLPKEAAV